MAKTMKEASKGPMPQMNVDTVEQTPVENKYPGVATRAYHSAPIFTPAETPVEETPVEDAQESAAE